jgi:adenine/guanine phosphoribosyltransferase-like PRPP-binding protein
VLSEQYALEYGTDTLEMHTGAVTAGNRVLLVDDLVATGGTLAAGSRLVARAVSAPRAARAVCAAHVALRAAGRHRRGGGLRHRTP